MGAHGLRDVGASRVHLVVEGEAALLGHTAALEVHRCCARAQQDALVASRLEEDHTVELVARELPQEPPRNLLIRHAGDQCARVDQRVGEGAQLDHFAHELHR